MLRSGRKSLCSAKAVEHGCRPVARQFQIIASFVRNNAETLDSPARATYLKCVFDQLRVESAVRVFARPSKKISLRLTKRAEPIAMPSSGSLASDQCRGCALT